MSLQSGSEVSMMIRRNRTSIWLLYNNIDVLHTWICNQYDCVLSAGFHQVNYVLIIMMYNTLSLVCNVKSNPLWARCEPTLYIYTQSQKAVTQETGMEETYSGFRGNGDPTVCQTGKRSHRETNVMPWKMTQNQDNAIYVTGIYYFTSTKFAGTFFWLCNNDFLKPSRHKTLNQCWFNVGPPSTTLDQR